MEDTSPSKIAVVTGANRGIGKEVAAGLIRQKITVILACKRYEAAVSAAHELKSFPDLAIPYHLDVTNQGDVQRLVRFVSRRFGKMDILINNAAIYPDDNRIADYGSIFNLDPEVFLETLDVNLVGCLRLIWALIPLMKQNNFGRIVNVSSGMSRFDDFSGNAPYYRISKTGLNALTKLVAANLENYNILVNAVCPGWTKTGMGGENALRTASQGAYGILKAALLPDGGPTGRFFRDDLELDFCKK